jgi:diaminopimelate epimerase
MCGNGLRCVIHFLRELGVIRTIYHIETLAGRHKGWFVGEEVCVQFPPPSHLHLHRAVDLHFLNTGVPHAVLFVPHLEQIDVALEGRKWRSSPLFAPAGANIDFATLQDDGSLAIRTYERGVEAETLACGTGAVAAALIAHKIYTLPSPIDVWVHSGERLKISFTPDWSEVTLQGKVSSYDNR